MIYDAIDKEVLQFLRVDDTGVLELVERDPDDASVAHTLLMQSGRTAEEVRDFKAKLRRKFDENRLPPGIKRTLLAFVYNRLLMPIFALAYRPAEKRRTDGGRAT